jgi:hypothetical protein
MSNVIDFQAKREERNKKNPQYIPIGSIEAAFDVVYDIDYDKFYNMFTQGMTIEPSQPKRP